MIKKRVAVKDILSEVATARRLICDVLADAALNRVSESETDLAVALGSLSNIECTAKDLLETTKPAAKQAASAPTVAASPGAPYPHHLANAVFNSGDLRARVVEAMSHVLELTLLSNENLLELANEKGNDWVLEAQTSARASLYDRLVSMLNFIDVIESSVKKEQAQRATAQKAAA